MRRSAAKTTIAPSSRKCSSVVSRVIGLSASNVTTEPRRETVRAKECRPLQLLLGFEARLLQPNNPMFHCLQVQNHRTLPTGRRNVEVQALPPKS
jgi:hypothetical protein